MVLNLGTVEKVFIAEYVRQNGRVYLSYNEVIVGGGGGIWRESKGDDQTDRQNKKKVPDLRDTKMLNNNCEYFVNLHNTG